MLRTTLIALAAATGMGLSAASAAPVEGTVITAAVYENGPVQQVWYYRHHRWWRHHHRRWWW
jgi:hypothetical protein